MSWLRFITVDSLCIAAEVTAALLLLAFAIPEKSKKVGVDPKAEETRKKLLELARRAFLDHQITRGLYWLEAESPKDIVFNKDDDADFATLETLGWLDRLSGSFNRAFFDEFLPRWLDLPAERRTGSTLTMLAVNDYSDLVRNCGSVEVERTLREIGNHLKIQFSENAMVGRYPPDRFLIIRFGDGPADAFQSAQDFQDFFDEQSKKSESLLKEIQLIASIVELSDETSSLDDLVNHLDDGVNQATESGSFCVAKTNGVWSSSPPPPDARSEARRSKSHSSPEGNAKRNAPASPSSSSDVASSLVSSSSGTSSQATNADSIPSEAVSDLESTMVQANEADTTEKKSSDVSAVASTEEIEALFQQLKKKDKTPEKQQPPAPAATEPTSVNEVASADDIAALFAAVKETTPVSNQLAAMEPRSDEPTPTEVAAIPTQPDIDLGEEATADDIADLFASIKGDSQLDASIESNTRPKMPPVDPSESASIDDIEELFRSVKSAATPSSEPTAKAEPQPLHDVDPNETASADDIESLLKAMGR